MTGYSTSATKDDLMPGTAEHQYNNKCNQLTPDSPASKETCSQTDYFTISASKFVFMSKYFMKFQSNCRLYDSTIHRKPIEAH